MFEYPKIGSTKGFRHNHCTAFIKYDGTNVGVEWTRKRGFGKFRLRKRLFDESDPHFGPAIPLFQAKFADDLAKVLTDAKEFRDQQRVVVFGEFFGPETFAGNHMSLPVGAKRDIVLFDVWTEPFGMLGPDTFVKLFGHLDIAKVVYRGKFTGQLTEDVRRGKYADKGVFEGVIIKAGKGGEDYEYAKVKTNAYMKKLQEVFGASWWQYWE